MAAPSSGMAKTRVATLTCPKSRCLSTYNARRNLALMVHEIPLGTLPRVPLPSTLVVSPESRHVATISPIGGAGAGRFSVTLDGTEVGQYDGVASGVSDVQ